MAFWSISRDAGVRSAIHAEDLENHFENMTGSLNAYRYRKILTITSLGKFFFTLFPA
ncbi:MAG: hypothetical protein HOM25_16640 [Rhodospirillaceae bacterium]|nr:hypothetical protein [Rhodospirillaceae bacterium]MBT5666059.1 hypothetical protein [Rhodospirillaceae bacterium]MBT5809385.1 hypothetical protein [Rhodospirillaceae bacterium]